MGCQAHAPIATSTHHKLHQGFISFRRGAATLIRVCLPVLVRVHVVQPAGLGKFSCLFAGTVCMASKATIHMGSMHVVYTHVGTGLQGKHHIIEGGHNGSLG
uniref:Uncharacterized protein n=1 Tax=Eutreptiella gymnastica TaxID=73025 RepID=A0A7S4LMH9_9EUGL